MLLSRAIADERLPALWWMIEFQTHAGDEVLKSVATAGLLWFPITVQFTMAMIHETVEPHCALGSSLRVNTQL